MKLLALVLFATAFLASVDCEEANKRCKYFDWLRACKLSCKVLGHTTGVCDSQDVCRCSEEDYNFFVDVTEFFGKLDISEVISKMVNKFNKKVKELRISENLKELVPSKCKVGQSFCSAACHSIGRVSGTCNADFTDCDCSDEKVSAKQYALCAEDTICRLDCQRQGFSTGVCKGSTGWDCSCVTKNSEEVVNTNNIEREEVEYPSQDEEDKDKVTFNA